jgi:hypothetical protein
MKASSLRSGSFSLHELMRDILGHLRECIEEGGDYASLHILVFCDAGLEFCFGASLHMGRIQVGY